MSMKRCSSLPFKRRKFFGHLTATGSLTFWQLIITACIKKYCLFSRQSLAANIQKLQQQRVSETVIEPYGVYFWARNSFAGVFFRIQKATLRFGKSIQPNLKNSVTNAVGVIGRFHYSLTITWYRMSKCPPETLHLWWQKISNPNQEKFHTPVTSRGKQKWFPLADDETTSAKGSRTVARPRKTSHICASY